MRHLGRIIHQGPRRIALLGGIVLLPAVALGLLAFRTFQGEQVRGEYQRRERQQQILRLLESDLGDSQNKLHGTGRGTRGWGGLASDKDASEPEETG